MKYYYWGRFRYFHSEATRMIWIGPMTEDEMKESFHEFRHNRSKSHYELYTANSESLPEFPGKEGWG